MEDGVTPATLLDTSWACRPAIQPMEHKGDISHSVSWQCTQYNVHAAAREGSRMQVISHHALTAHGQHSVCTILMLPLELQGIEKTSAGAAPRSTLLQSGAPAALMSQRVSSLLTWPLATSSTSTK
jgi:hypothetical protein